MRKTVWKKLTVLALTFVLAAQSVTGVFAASPETLLQKVSKTSVPAMEAFDYSEKALEKANLSMDEFMNEMNVTEEDLLIVREEMCNELGLATVDVQSVSQNDISANDVVMPQKATYSTLEDAAEYLRGKMVARKDILTITVAGSKDSALKNVNKILEKVFEYDVNGKPTEGDYLYWHMRGMKCSVNSNGDGTQEIYLGLYYRSDASEEKFVTARIKEIIRELDLKSSSLNEYEKVRRIYDKVMSIITYDYYHYQYDQNYQPMYTTYGALSTGYAVCQAYATLFYRLCEEVDISARVICGIDDAQGNPTHGWNIVKIGNKYYNLDATWDDEMYGTYPYFLKNMADFKGHQRNSRNAGETFDKKFVMADVSYPIPEMNASAAMINVPNIAGSIKLVDGTSYSLTAQGKTKVLFFINPNEDGCTRWLDSLYTTSSIASGACDVAVIDIFDSYDKYDEGTDLQIMQLMMQMAENPYIYKYSMDHMEGLKCRNQYAALTGKQSGCYTSLAVIDASNNLRYFGNVSEVLGCLDDLIYKCSPASLTTVTGLTGSQTANNVVSLSWQPASGVTGYMVYAKKEGGQYYCLGTTTATTYQAKITPGMPYSFVVAALYGGNEIGRSNEFSLATSVRLPKKGKTYTVNGGKYKVLKSTSTTKTVAFKGVTNKKLKKVIIPNTIEIEGVTYQVTEIASGALKNNKKVKTVIIGSNVTKIGSNAFAKAKNLNNIVINSKKLKKVGSKAFSGIHKKAEIRVPSSKYKKYKSLLKGKGQSSSVKIKK